MLTDGRKSGRLYRTLLQAGAIKIELGEVIRKPALFLAILYLPQTFVHQLLTILVLKFEQTHLLPVVLDGWKIV